MLIYQNTKGGFCKRCANLFLRSGGLNEIIQNDYTKGNKEFYLIDEQKVAYETVKKLVEKSIRDSNKPNGVSQKYTIIIEGGQGTGVPINTA